MADGTLESTMADALDADENWIEDADWDYQSHSQYTMVAEAWEQIRGAEDVPREMDAKAQAFMNVLITYSGYCTDLGKGCEVIVVSVSPESAERLARTVARVDFSAYRGAFHAKCDKRTKEAFGECSERGVERGFEEGFIPYVQTWIDQVSTAAKKKRGLLMVWG